MRPGSFGYIHGPFSRAVRLNPGFGWNLDTQFIQQMGSPYLIARGLGRPVDDATKQITVKQAGQYRVWVRTIDWTARWNASTSPGQTGFDGRCDCIYLTTDLTSRPPSVDGVLETRWSA